MKSSVCTACQQLSVSGEESGVVGGERRVFAQDLLKRWALSGGQLGYK